MKDDQFFEFVYKQYCREQDETNGLYQKCTLAILPLPIIAGASVALGRGDTYREVFSGTRVLLYWEAALVTFVALAAAMVFIGLCVIPKRDYEGLDVMTEWHKWRNDRKRQGHGDVRVFNELCERLAEAQAKGAKKNERRRQHFRKALCSLVVAVSALGAQAFFYFLLTR